MTNCSMEKRYNQAEQEERIKLMWEREQTYRITPDESAPIGDISHLCLVGHPHAMAKGP